MHHKILRWYYTKRGKVSPVRTIVLAFGFIVLLGACLLMLPFASVSGKSAGFINALFTATSSTCVTGLVVAETGLAWSNFGQAVILCLIQVGGLGFMTVVSTFFFLSGRKMGLKQRMIIAQSYSMNDFQDVASLVKKAVVWTFSAEAIGAVVLTLRFSVDMPWARAIWCGVFHAISAFCNAGFDILAMVDAGGSLAGYATDATVNITVMLLVISGGLGFFVLDDLARSRCWKKLSVYSKLVLATNAVLLFGGTFLFAVLEWNNALSFGGFTAWEKILASAFQSVTTRTAGFYTVPQGRLTDASLAVSDLLMFVGGSSGSTAGGAKTVTVAVIVLSTISAMRGKKTVSVFRRTLSGQQIKDATCLVFLMFFFAVAGAVFLSASNAVPMSHAFFESISALCTVGISVGITSELNLLSKLLLILYMFFGRVGIMTFSLAVLFGDRTEERFCYAEEKMMIG